MADKSAKAGRNSDFCKAYKTRGQRETNKVTRIARAAAKGLMDPDLALKAIDKLANVPTRVANSAIETIKAAKRDETWSNRRYRTFRRKEDSAQFGPYRGRINGSLPLRIQLARKSEEASQ